MHLFDINIPGKVKFKESEVLAPGNRPVCFQTEFGKIGLGICYDLRFPELAMHYASKGSDRPLFPRQDTHLVGCFLVAYPGAFTETTGPLHWELLLRSRALDNQIYTVGVSGSPNEIYRAWGHSLAVNPTGTVLTAAKRDEALLVVDLDLSTLNETRSNIPVLRQKRHDLYHFGFVTGK